MWSRSSEPLASHHTAEAIMWFTCRILCQGPSLSVYHGLPLDAVTERTTQIKQLTKCGNECQIWPGRTSRVRGLGPIMGGKGRDDGWRDSGPGSFT